MTDIIIGPGDAPYAMAVNPDGSINTTAVGGGANVTIVNPVSVNSGVTGIASYLMDPATGLPVGYTGATTVAGGSASGVAVSGNPLLDGGRAATAQPTAVADGQSAAIMLDKVGRQAVVPHGVRDLISDQTTAAIVDTTVTTIVTAAASTFNDLIGLIFANAGTATTVTIKDDTTTRATFYLPATDTRGIVFAAPFKQAVVNKNWTATCTGTPSVIVTTQFVKNI